jgi:hypothetical protein
MTLKCRPGGIHTFHLKPKYFYNFYLNLTKSAKKNIYCSVVYLARPTPRGMICILKQERFPNFT